jgi:sulfatase maturation enzyme AslB (radical SAM superfamily)
MHPQLNQLIDLVHRHRPQTRTLIHTSGSHAPSTWSKVLATLKPDDSVMLSVDGLEDTNHLYRVGSKWSWVEEALQACPQHVDTTWKFIVFKHNEHQIEEAIETAKSYGVQNFLLTKSHIFNGMWLDETGLDPLAPSPYWQASAAPTVETITPKCQNSSMHYLSAQGEYSPCCWTQPYQEFRFPISQDKPLTQIMQNPKLMAMQSQWSNFGPEICARKCSAPEEGRSSHSQLKLNLTSPMESLLQSVQDFRKSATNSFFG